MKKAKITSKRQITVPIAVMRKLGLNPGDSLIFEEKDNYIEVLQTKKKFSALDLIGKYSHLSKVKLTTEELCKAREEAWTMRYKDYLKRNNLK